LASRVVKSEDLVEESLKLAGKIASLSNPIVMAAKEAVNFRIDASGL
jgi:enoyl-CoA hydratase/carnithine racemase